MNLFKRLTFFIRTRSERVRVRWRNLRKRTLAYINRNPVKSFYLSLALFVLLIVASNLLGNPKPKEKPAAETVKEVEEFAIGSVPRMKVLAKVEKSGVVTISALTPGVVKYIKTPVGTNVAKGQNLLGLASNYQGGNASSLQRQLAALQYKNASDNKDLQHELLQKQRELAEKADTNADELRKITDLSVGETGDLVNLANDILAQLDASIAGLEQTNVNGANDALILSTKQLKSQFLAARNGAAQGMRMAIYNVDAAHPPAQMSDLQREIALKQLDLQDRMIDVNVEVARLQLAISQVVEGMMYPAAPISGTVQKVSVRIGQSVNPGAELMVIAGDPANLPSRANAYVPDTLAKRIPLTEDSVLHLAGGVTVKTKPLFVSSEAVSGTLYGVYFLIPPEYAKDTVESGYISVDLPVGYAQTTAAVPFIPIDAVYQTKETNTVFVDAGGVATGKTVELGDVSGSFVEVTKGLSAGDAVILNRTVIGGDKVKRSAP